MKGKTIKKIIGCSDYSMGPLNFRHRGLGVVQVFVIMGVVMVHTWP
ncbi:hypothetical protein MNBD_GAMMA26-2111 [hydrothermal vent metagenome]|uniref:Uncharacterized protein n=1 Tax=hydrothermal vent metagenome TaxID=652676 RepID=A0A3B1B173_9ZZZZ